MGTPLDSGALARNQSARDYEYRGKFTPSYARSSTATRLDSWLTMQATWGNAYSSVVPKHGIEIYCHVWVDSPGVTEHYEIVLSTPWGNVSTSGTGWPVIEFRVLGEALTLTGGCDDWSHTATDYKLYVKLNGGAETLVGTVTAGTISGTGYDHRLNVVVKFDDCSVNPMPLMTFPACGSSYATAPTKSWSVDNGVINAGFRYYEGGSWHNPAISLDTGLSPPTPVVQSGCGACGCTTSLQGIGATDCYTQSLGSSMSYELTATLLAADRSCPCDSGLGSPAHYEFWSTRHEFIHKMSFIHDIPNGSGITKTTRERAARCWCDPDADIPDYTTVTSTIVESTTYSEAYRYAKRMVSERLCSRLIAPGACPPGDTFHPCYPFTDTFCCYEAYVWLYWPDKPACGGGSPTYDVGLGHRHYRAFLDGSSVYFGHRDNGASGWTDFDTGLTADWVTLRIDRMGKEQRIYLWTEESGSIKQRVSTSEGASWSAPSTLGSGAKPTGFITLSGLRFVCWISGGNARRVVYDRAGSVLEAEATAVAGVDNLGLAAADQTYGKGKVRTLLAVVIGGSLKLYTAPDRSTFALNQTIGSGEYPQIVSGASGRLFLYWIKTDGGSGWNVRGVLLDRILSGIEAEFTAISGVDGGGCAADEFIFSGGKHRVRLLAFAGGALIDETAPDGKTFSP